MSVLNCIGSLVAQNKITKEQADRARAIYRGVFDDAALDGMDPVTREAHAALKTAQIMTDAIQARKLELARRTEVYNSNLDRIKAHPNGPIAGFMGLYDRDIRNAAPGEGFDRTNVTSLEREHYAPQIAAKMHEMDTIVHVVAAPDSLAKLTDYKKQFDYVYLATHANPSGGRDERERRPPPP